MELNAKLIFWSYQVPAFDSELTMKFPCGQDGGFPYSSGAVPVGSCHVRWYIPGIVTLEFASVLTADQTMKFRLCLAIIISPASFVISATCANNTYLAFMQQPLLPRRLHPWSSLTRFLWLMISQSPPRMKPCHESWLLPLSLLLHPVPFLLSPARRMQLRSVPDLVHWGCSFWNDILCWCLAMPYSLNWNLENQSLLLFAWQVFVHNDEKDVSLINCECDGHLLFEARKNSHSDRLHKSKTNATFRCPDARSVRLLLCSTVISRCSIENTRFLISLSHNTKLTPSWTRVDLCGTLSKFPIFFPCLSNSDHDEAVIWSLLMSVTHVAMSA